MSSTGPSSQTTDFPTTLPPDPKADTWRAVPAAQQPEWPDPGALRAVTDELTTLPPLVAASECDTLRDRLAAVARGEAFLLQGGDCAETFDSVTADQIGHKLKTLWQMAAILTYGSELPVVKVGRIAGQYAKPRSSSEETLGGVTLPSYRGDAVNGLEFTPQARRPDPGRLRQVYDHSAATLNFVRAATSGGIADLAQVHTWNREFLGLSPAGQRYEHLAGDIDGMLRFMRASGADPDRLSPTEFFTSHEALILDYESALTRVDSRTGALYDVAGHMVWIGERTRQVDGAHVEFARHISNPVAVKLGPATTSDDALALIERLDPERRPGRLTFISRMGADQIREKLPRLVEKVQASGAQVVWVCDPMHGNTYTAPDGHKTRRFDAIMDEITGFFEVHRALGSHPGGIHLELTGTSVTECVGGTVEEVTEDELGFRYESACDPRLNHSQSLDLAFLTAEIFRR
ncbi:3-deoxy-7-phosphoheptulonate synthase class II [Streptomyces sp. N2-109]|uniref:Phospho-2-dehydro-3-deoxyheptonate aldolase n=1 Tax=Streptomyces gossypii TaxID=2883101 RepID=A0ABT2JLW6_9ACTN|nr:3-deoxy-7-phosphoheptulonate synthase class II [Streptomyces gossypii]MCT2588876.1 3-deoxy-7-phosphoheptulonate synthase class II [Streptomyces gossypii]